MQKIVLFLFAILFAIPTYAQRERSLLKIRDQEGRMISAEINGRRYEKVAKTLTFSDLPARSHRLRIYVVNRTRNGRRARLIYAGRLRTKPGKIHYVTVDDYEGLDVITDCCLDDDGPWNEPNSWYRSRYYDQQNWESDIQFNPKKDHYYNSNQNRQNGNQRNNRRQDNARSDNNNQFANAMSTARFNDLLNSMEAASFENNRMQVVKQALDRNQLTTTQLTKIMKTLSFESSRLRIAKMAYPKVVDKQNTYKINQGFTFASSRDDFDKFVENSRR